MRILVTGSNGMLGSDIVKIFLNNNYKVFGIDKNDNINNNINFYKMDLTNLIELKKVLRNINPDLIIHTAAFVDVNFCENNIQKAIDLHVVVTRILAKFGCQMIYISTDSVFNGIKGNYTEDDIPDPLNVYARTKLLGEFATLSNNKKATVIRTNIFGFHKDKLRNSLAE